MMEELKPCPFCGSEAELTHNKQWDYFVRCTNKQCACKTRMHHDNRTGAIITWNSRIKED